MTISSITNRVSFSGNGVTTVFSYPYYFLQNADLVVIKKVVATGVETTQTITTNYTVTGAGVQAGGSVTMLVAPATGETLSIYRDPAKTQDLDLVENDPLPAEELEERFDKLTMIVQRLQDQIDRSIRLTDGYAGTFSNLRLPALIEATKVLRVNAAGTGLDLADQESFTFDNSSPLTTKGDILAHDGTNNTRKAVGGAKGALLISEPTQTDGLLWLAAGSDGAALIADSSQTSGLSWGTSVGGGTFNWVESTDSPAPAILNNIQTYAFQATLGQALYGVFKVPANYRAGKQIFLKAAFYSPDSSGNVLISSVATLIRAGTDLISSTTNQRTSTNAAVTLSGATVNIPQSLSLDLSSSTGQINAVSISANDIILVKLTRGTDTATSDVLVPAFAGEVTF